VKAPVNITNTPITTTIRAVRSPLRPAFITLAVGAAVWYDAANLHLLHRMIGGAGVVVCWVVFLGLLAWSWRRTSNYVKDRKWARKQVNGGGGN